MIPLKQFCAEEGERLGLKPKTVWKAFYRGNFPNLGVRRINQRVILIDETSDRTYIKRKTGKKPWK